MTIRLHAKGRSGRPDNVLPSMEIVAFRSLWGLEDEPLDESFARIAAQGFAGVEVAPQLHGDPSELRHAAARHGLIVKPLLLLAGDTVAQQIDAYPELLRMALELDPDGATVHSGRDCWSPEESVAFYRAAVDLEAELGLGVGHETHRGRSLFTPWDTAAILEAVPQLRLTCDFSHWADVAADALAAHERWWECIWEAQRAAGATRTTFTPEYGPPPYLPEGLSPADLEEVCLWQTERTRARFEAWSALG